MRSCGLCCVGEPGAQFGPSHPSIQAAFGAASSINPYAVSKTTISCEFLGDSARCVFLDKRTTPPPDSEAYASRNSLVCEKLTSRVNFSKHRAFSRQNRCNEILHFCTQASLGTEGGEFSLS
jgi:hypothetical protein